MSDVHCIQKHFTQKLRTSQVRLIMPLPSASNLFVKLPSNFQNVIMTRPKLLKVKTHQLLASVTCPLVLICSLACNYLCV